MAKVKVETHDNDEVTIRYVGLVDFDGDKQEVVLRLRVWEGEDNFQLSIDTECDSNLRFELNRPKDVTLNFEDIAYAEDWDSDGACTASCSCQCDSGECDCNPDEEECDCCGGELPCESCDDFCEAEDDEDSTGCACDHCECFEEGVESCCFCGEW